MYGVLISHKNKQSLEKRSTLWGTLCVLCAVSFFVCAFLTLLNILCIIGVFSCIVFLFVSMSNYWRINDILNNAVLKDSTYVYLREQGYTEEETDIAMEELNGV